MNEKEEAEFKLIFLDQSKRIAKLEKDVKELIGNTVKVIKLNDTILKEHKKLLKDIIKDLGNLKKLKSDNDTEFPIDESRGRPGLI